MEKIHTMEAIMNRKNSRNSVLEKCNPKANNEKRNSKSIGKKYKSTADCNEKHSKVGKPAGFKHTAPWIEDEKFISSLNILLSNVDEQKRRQITALFSMQIGYGGDTRLAEVTGLHVDTIRLGREELSDGLTGCPEDRIRKKGGGSKKVEEQTPGIEEALEKIVEDNIAGDPCSNKKWVRLAAREISKRLKKKGFKVSANTVVRLLKKQDIHLK